MNGVNALKIGRNVLIWCMIGSSLTISRTISRIFVGNKKEKEFERLNRMLFEMGVVWHSSLFAFVKAVLSKMAEQSRVRWFGVLKQPPNHHTHNGFLPCPFFYDNTLACLYFLNNSQGEIFNSLAMSKITSSEMLTLPFSTI